MEFKPDESREDINFAINHRWSVNIGLETRFKTRTIYGTVQIILRNFQFSETEYCNGQ